MKKFFVNVKEEVSLQNLSEEIEKGKKVFAVSTGCSLDLTLAKLGVDIVFDHCVNDNGKIKMNEMGIYFPDYCWKRVAVMHAIFCETKNFQEEKWKEYYKDGFVTMLEKPCSWEGVSKGYVFGANNRTEGFVIPEFFKFFFIGFFRARESNSATVYFVSSDIKKIEKILKLENIFDSCMQSIKERKSFPKKIVFNILKLKN